MTPSRRQCLSILAGLAMTPWLSACRRPTPPRLTIASHVWPGYELMFLAQREGWLADPGVHLLETASATDSLAALAQGRADGAALTLDETLRARAEGIDLRIVLVFDVSAGADMLLARPGIRRLDDLAGKRIGVEQSALGALMLHQALAAAGLPKDAVTLVPLTADGHLAAWQAGGLDAILTYEPTASRLVAGGARRLFDSRDIPDTIFDVLAITARAAQRAPEALSALIAGHFRALGHLRRHPQDAAHRLAGRLGIAADNVLDAYRGLELPNPAANRKLLSGGELTRAAATLDKIMLEAGLLKKPAPLSPLVLDRFLP